MVAALIAQVPYQWRNVTIVGGGFVDGIICHPAAKNVIYARTDMGGAYRLDPSTRRWVPLQDTFTRKDWNLFGVESIALDRSDPNRVYMAVGTYTNDWGGLGAILISQDQGKTWSRVNLPFKNGGNEDGRGIGERLAVDPNEGRLIYFGTRHNGLWKSVDSGLHWAQDKSFPTLPKDNGIGIGWVLFDGRARNTGPTQTIYVAPEMPGTPLYRSHDAGKTWQPIGGSPSMFPHHGALTSNGALIVTYGNGPGPNGVSDGAVKRLETDNTWNDITPIRPNAQKGFGYAGLSLDPSNPHSITVSSLDRWGQDTLFKSVDDGETWNQIRLQAVRDSSKSPFLNGDRQDADFGHWIANCTIDPFDSNRAWYVTGATIWTTHDFLNADKYIPTHWSVGAEGIEQNAIIKLVSPTKGAALISALGDIGGFVHDYLSESPPVILHPLLSNTDDLDFAGQNPAVIVRVGRSYGGKKHGGISEDYGKTWHELANDPPGGGQGGSVAISASGKRVLWGLGGNLPHYSDDQGVSWSPCNGLRPGLQLLSDRIHSNVFFAYDSRAGEVYKSVDGGQSFQLLTRVGAQDTSPLVAVPNQETELWVAHSKGLSISKNGGKSFVQIDSNLQSAESVGYGKPAPGSTIPTMFVIGVVNGTQGVWRSTDEAKTWVRINDASTGLGTMEHVIGDPKVFGRAYVGTNGRGIFVADPVKSMRASRY